EVVHKNEPNFLISPYSAETVLAFAQSGCKDETAQEIRNSLRLPNDNDNVEAGVKESLSVLQGNNLYTLHTANKMYVKEDFPIKQSFKQAATEIYHSDVENIDFTQSQKAAKTMNSWVEKQTNNKIKNLISPNILSKRTKTILINAIYFQGNWSNKFYDVGTQKKSFYKTNKEVLQVDTMHHYRQWFNYYESADLDAKFLEMPFAAFDANEADLSGIAGEKGDLIISDVLQKTYIDVEEGGVEAAAATYVETALAFAHSGCKEKTALEIRKSLHLSGDGEKIESAVKESISILNEKKPYTLQTANKMYDKEGYSIKEIFKKTATEIYGADVENINFEQSIEAATSMND
ncbi:Serpin domain containing protein, partial [Asbolus verrucosus]